MPMTTATQTEGRKILESELRSLKAILSGKCVNGISLGSPGVTEDWVRHEIEARETVLAKPLPEAVAAICDDDHGKHALKATGAAVFLISEAVRNGATDLTVDLVGATDGKSELGNWKITIKKLGPA
jgi:hypothetical protein